MKQVLRVREGLLPRLREIRGLCSDEALAELIGVSRTTLYRAECGSAPSPALTLGICLAFGLSPGEVLEVVPAHGHPRPPRKPEPSLG
ncbi:helix-turn-helix transcriptional regulator [Mycetocola spongiae]|uniref:helix-turn-helix transcriptional regulator n=1 Tax=Mycetocola spongiae TaxID=2859226 RepID=UPI001CF139AE|nr:helix-turn-helix transcriptional regulator [Mycetocola spongiae]